MWSKTWTDKERDIVIEEVRKRPFIYDSTDPDYKNKERRMQAFEEIAMLLTNNMPGGQQIDGRCVSGQWKILKDTFNRTRKVIESKSPSPFSPHSTPVWRFYRQLEFLTHQPSPYSMPNINGGLGNASGSGIVQLKTTDEEYGGHHGCDVVLDDERPTENLFDHTENIFDQLGPGLHQLFPDKHNLNDDVLSTKVEDGIGGVPSDQAECSNGSDRKRPASSESGNHLEEIIVDVVKRRICDLPSPQQVDDHDLFGKIVASSLRDLATYDEKLGIEMRHDINNVIHNYMLKKYNGYAKS